MVNINTISEQYYKNRLYKLVTGTLHVVSSHISFIVWFWVHHSVANSIDFHFNNSRERVAFRVRKVDLYLQQSFYHKWITKASVICKITNAFGKFTYCNWNILFPFSFFCFEIFGTLSDGDCFERKIRYVDKVNAILQVTGL